MNDPDSQIIGFFSSVEHTYDESEEEERRIDGLDEEFRSYLSGKTGLSDKLGRLDYKEYGRDLMLILYQFYIFPSELSLQYIREIERYRPKEKAVGVSVIVTEENFFNKSEADRRAFLKGSILHGLDLVDKMVKRRKLDTDIQRLKSDVESILR